MKQTFTNMTKARRHAMTRSRIAAFAAILGTLTTVPAGAHQRTIVDITGVISSPYRINNAGDILGSGMDGTTPYPALLHNGVLIRLPVFVPASDSGTQNSYKLNNKGQVMYYAYTNGVSGDISTRILDVNTGITTDLGKITGFPSLIGLSFNDSGDVVGYASSPTQTRAFLLHNGHFTQLPPLAGASAGATYGYGIINNHGDVLGAVRDGGVTQTLIWRNGVANVLHMPTPANEEIGENGVIGFNDRDEALTTYQDFMYGTSGYHVLTLDTPPIVDDFIGPFTNEALGFNNNGNVLDRDRDTQAGHFGTDWMYGVSGGTPTGYDAISAVSPTYYFVGANAINDNVDVVGTVYQLASNSVYKLIVSKVVPAPVPQIAGLTPDRTLPGMPSIPVTITGTDFDIDSTVLVNGVAQDSSHFLSATQMRVVMPTSVLAHAGAVSIQVVTRGPGGGPSNIKYFNVAVPRPTLTDVISNRLDPSSSPTEILLSGLDFDPGAVVTINDTTTITPIFVSSYLLRVPISASITSVAGQYFVRVVNPGWSNASNPGAFKVQYPAPFIASMSPTRIPASLTSQSLYIVGNFDAASAKVSFNGGAPITPTSATYTRVIVPIPAYVLAHPGDYAVRVVNSFANGGASAPATLSVATRPALTSLTPSSVKTGSGAATVTLTGTNFETTSTVTINNGTPITPTFVSSTKLTVVVPTSVTSVKGGYSVRVVNTGYTNFSNPLGFNVTP